jgi:hypothetical protein
LTKDVASFGGGTLPIIGRATGYAHRHHRLPRDLVF